MKGARRLFWALALTLCGCSASGGPPAELSGLWSAGPAACAAGVGVQFDADAIAAVYDSHRETLFEHPHYDVETSGDQFRVRIVYALPQQPGGATSLGAHGVLVLARTESGALTPYSHNLVDPRTGSARMRIADDPAMSALNLEPCTPHGRASGLRGREA
jgi:hypothetical protein